MITSQRGNILFLILLAIILFVALTYAVNSGMRGGGKNASSENASQEAAVVSNYISLAQTTANRLRLVNGCTTITYNGGATQCRLDLPGAGGMSKWMTSNITTEDRVVAGIGTDAADRVLTIWPTTDAMPGFTYNGCIAFNKAQGVPGNPNCTLGQQPLGSQMFTTTPPIPELYGHYAFCWANTDRCDLDRVDGHRNISGVLISN